MPEPPRGAPDGTVLTPSVPANAATAMARTVVDALVAGGVRHAVLSPGSRSAALALALVAAAEEGRVTLHTRIDERTGGFLALGIAQTSRRPVPVLTTSGTATANLHPAVLEAAHAGVPLIVLTADRPAHLRGTGANQTTVQAGLYGGAVREAADVPAPVPGHDEAGQLRAWRALVGRALAAATGDAGRPRGPVHLNLQQDGPLVPDVADGWSTPLPAPGHPRTSYEVAAGATNTDDVPGARRRSRHFADDRRTVVVAGDDAGPPARVLAEAGDWPLLAEPTSGSRTGDHAIRTSRLLLADDALAADIERVVVAGHPTLSRPVTRLLSRTDVEVVALRHRATGDVTDPGHTVGEVLDAATAEPGPTDWLTRWRGRDAEVAARLDALLDGWAPLTPHHVAAAVAGAVEPGALLVVGASNPIRDLDLMVPRWRVGERRMLIANRGLSGIDGTVSTAMGAALGRPHSTRALALLGDVTFLHDLTGLVLGPAEQRPDLTLVVVNDDGGSIFTLLEQGSPTHAGAFEKAFGTPHGANLGRLCAGAGVAHARVADREALRAELAAGRAGAGTGVRVVEAVVRRDDRRALDAAIRALVGTGGD